MMKRGATESVKEQSQMEMTIKVEVDAAPTSAVSIDSVINLYHLKQEPGLVQSVKTEPALLVKEEILDDSSQDGNDQQGVQGASTTAGTGSVNETSGTSLGELCNIKYELIDIDIGPTVLQHMDRHYISNKTVCGDVYHISQGTVSNIITKVSNVISRLTSDIIKFPDQQIENQILFQEMGKTEHFNGIPGVIGAIDCTHIRIVSTPGHVHSEAFRNRKSYFSFNIQAVAGPRGEFLDIIARYAGSTHDSRIFQMSPLFIRLRNQSLSGILLGDNGYPCLPFVFTPILRPQRPSEQNYNRAHIKARNIVERMFGVWKKRFPCLSRGMGNKLTTTVNIIVSCAVLHNMALICNDQLPDEPEQVLEEVVDVPLAMETNSGFARRQAIIDTYF